MTLEEFEKRVQTSQPGESFVFYTGFLALDQSEVTRQLAVRALLYGSPKGTSVFVGRVQDHERYERALGIGHLKQRRLGENEYEYIFERAA